MAEDEREAAWHRLLPFQVLPDERVDPRAEVRGLVGRVAFDAGFDAGIAEGIRQAREAAEAAVAGDPFLDDGTIHALRAIDALTHE